MHSEDYQEIQEIQEDTVSVLLNFITIIKAKSPSLKGHYIITSESAIMLSLGYLWYDVFARKPMTKWPRLFKRVTTKIKINNFAHECQMLSFENHLGSSIFQNSRFCHSVPCSCTRVDAWIKITDPLLASLRKDSLLNCTRENMSVFS